MALTENVLTFIENGTPQLFPDARWKELQLSGVIDRLQEMGVVRHREIAGFHEIEPKQFVGTARLPGRKIVIEPKVRAFFEYASELISNCAQRRALGEENVLRKSSSEFVNPVIAFIASGQDIIFEGIPFEYSRQRAITSRPKGRLIPRDTIRECYSRGVKHKAIFEHPKIIVDPIICGISKPTIDFLRSIGSVTAAQTAMIDELEKVLVTGINPSNLQVIIDDARKRIDRSDIEGAVQLYLRTCLRILSDHGTVWDIYTPFEGGELQFCSMDKIWELLLFYGIDANFSAYPLQIEFHPFSQITVRLVSPKGPDIDPDIVVFDGTTPEAVVDAKYKICSAPISTDVYQIFAYTHSLKTKMGVLVYLSESDGWKQEIGKTDHGAGLVAYGIDIKDISNELRKMAEDIGQNLLP